MSFCWCAFTPSLVWECIALPRYTPLDTEEDLTAACQMTDTLFVFMDARETMSSFGRSIGDSHPKLTFVAKTVRGLLAHLSGFTRTAQAGIANSHHDFHPLVFFLVLLERTLRHLTYPQLTHLQKRWALHAAAMMTKHLKFIWDNQLCEDGGSERRDKTHSTSHSPAILNTRFGGQLWNTQKFASLEIAWRGVHRAVAQDRDVISRLDAELVRQCDHRQTLCDHRQTLIKAKIHRHWSTMPKELCERHQELQDLRERHQELRERHQELHDWFSRPESEAPPKLDADQRQAVGQAIELTVPGQQGAQRVRFIPQIARDAPEGAAVSGPWLDEGERGVRLMRLLAGCECA